MELTVIVLESDDSISVKDLTDGTMQVYSYGIVVSNAPLPTSNIFYPWGRVLSIESVDGPLLPDRLEQ